MKSERGAISIALLVIVVIIGVAVALVLIMGPRESIEIGGAGRKVLQDEIRAVVSFPVKVQMIRDRLQRERETLIARSVKVKKSKLSADKMREKIEEKEASQKALKAKMKVLRAHYEKAKASGSDKVTIGGSEFSSADVLGDMTRKLSEYEQTEKEIEITREQRKRVLEASKVAEDAINQRKLELSTAESKIAALVAKHASVEAIKEADALVSDLVNIEAGLGTETSLGLIARLDSELDDELMTSEAFREQRSMTNIDAALKMESAGNELMDKMDKVLGEE